MKYLGLDLGTKTLGTALSDQKGVLAFFNETLFFKNEDYHSLLPKLKEIIEEEKIDKIVLGLPKNMNNTLGEAAERCLNFKKILEEEFHKEVIMQDERLSTKEASTYMIEADCSRKMRKKKIDGLAATIILQTYLDRKGE